MKNFLMILVIIAFAACGGADKKAEEVKRDEPLIQSKNSPEFNAAFAVLLTDYFHLKDAFVLSNDTMINALAQRLGNNADSIKLAGLNADSSIMQVAKSYAESISAEVKGLLGEANLEGKRKSFQMISDNLYDLVRTVQYDRAKVYHQYCPMAFNDAGAYWLSNTADIKNPYFGKKMLTCGEVKDTLDFTKQ